MTDALRINTRIAIPRSELLFTFVRSSGPGGPNVNKDASKAVLRWAATSSPSIPDDVRARLLARAARQINDRGELVLTSQRYRDQSRNKDDCLEKLRSLIASVAKAPRIRRKTKPSKSSREARLKDKRAASQKKQRRGRPTLD
jgi:ribosome-associated protein